MNPTVNECVAKIQELRGNDRENFFWCMEYRHTELAEDCDLTFLVTTKNPTAWFEEDEVYCPRCSVEKDVVLVALHNVPDVGLANLFTSLPGTGGLTVEIATTGEATFLPPAFQ